MGGSHALYGTHNRLFKIATPHHPLAYFEIIAIDTTVAWPPSPTAKRWFDLDDEALRAAVAEVPRLVNFVVSTGNIQRACAALRPLDIDPGAAVQTERHSRKGLLQWQITVREDGQRQFNGALPSLIQWGKPTAVEPLRLHPRNSLPRSRVTLRNIAVSHPDAVKLAAAYAAIELADITLTTGPANLAASLQTPKGLVTLQSLGV